MQNDVRGTTMKFDRKRIEDQIKVDFDNNEEWIRDNDMKDTICKFFEEYDELLDQRRVRQTSNTITLRPSPGRIQQHLECVGGTPEDVTVKRTRQEST